MVMKSCCSISDHDIEFLKEIQNTESDLELWAYGLEKSRTMGIIAFEFAIFNGRCWYEFFQRFITINDEEYARIHIIKHENKSLTPSEFPIRPYERMYENKKEKSWTRVLTISFPFSIFLYRDILCTCNEKQNGEKILRDKCAEIAVSFESEHSNALLQVTTQPYFLRLCRTDEELSKIEIIWEFHFTDEKEMEQLRLEKSEEFFHCQRLEKHSRTKLRLSGHSNISSVMFFENGGDASKQSAYQERTNKELTTSQQEHLS